VEIIPFAKKKKIEGFLKHILLDTVLNTTGSVKYLGLILDAKLTWRMHVKGRISAA
jgi:hypothetical protein